MKKLLALILNLLRETAVRKIDNDDDTWQHLDGAEFYTVLPGNTPPVTSN